jgi:hypothetical protein
MTKDGRERSAVQRPGATGKSPKALVAG